MRLFTDNQEAIGYGVEYMRIFSPFLIGVVSWYCSITCCVRWGDVKITIWMGISEGDHQDRFRVPVLLALGISRTLVCFAHHLVVRGRVGALRYISGVWQRKIKE